MCGIFGLIIKEKTKLNDSLIESTLKKLAEISIARGKDSSGVVFKNRTKNTFDLIKGDIPINKLLDSKEFGSALKESIELYKSGQSFQAIGHARLVTNGSQLKEENNQPVVKDGIIAIHNGIIVNADKLWEKNNLINREYEIDTEILLSLVRKDLNDLSTHKAIKKCLKQIEGTASCAMLFDDRNEVALFTNNGSLYYVLENNFMFFASEKHFLIRVLEYKHKKHAIKQLKANEGFILDLNDFSTTSLSDWNNKKSELHSKHSIYKINLKGDFDKEIVIDPMEFIDKRKESYLLSILEDNSEEISLLKRCTKCILPETFPFIEFDEKGVCNFCKNYRPKKEIQNFDTLKELVKKYKNKNGAPDCIVPFSGGRDSTYTLHIVKKELGLNPIAFTYDWGMVTDLARRNIARVCGKLGVENIVVSADIKWKRENIRKNIEAWLNNPNLGMIPIFMAGDKYFFYYCNQVKKQTGIDLNIWGINDLENTNFKTGFAGLRPQFEKKRIYSLSVLNQLKLFGFVGKNLIKSPGYINQSVFDSLGSFAVRYLSPKKDYYHLFDYYKWDENELEALIKEEYNWEKSIDTESTWRIGDGTASFYNYIYYIVAGFTENDTFRSNQIREGQISREDALNKTNIENKVRYETLRWYLEIIGVDFTKVITRINSIPKLYKNKID